MNTQATLSQSAFLFEDCQRFDAECEHNRLRNSLETDINVPPTADPWKQRPVDFTMKNFHPKRKKNIYPSSIGDKTPKEKQSEIFQRENSSVMKPFSLPYQNITQKHEKNNHNRFSFDTRIKYDHVKRMLNTEQYNNPKLHDYRQYPDINEFGLAEFSTKYDRDPYNIRFHSDHLNTLWLQDRKHERIPVVEEPLASMYRALTAKPKWESRLVLPKLVYPNKYVAYTRYRNPTRTIQSAYWERVESKLEQEQTKRLNVI